MENNFKVVGITETTILDDEGKVVFDAGALEHTALENHERAKKITKLFAAAPDMLEALRLIAEENYDDDDKKRHLQSRIDSIKKYALSAISKATE
jgi:NAD(P)H-hydrate repair Nnr-like enzyme with NAD(P)H-hydrate dehydratase domain